MNNQKFSFYKLQSNNSNLDYWNIFTNQIDFCFSKLSSGQLIRTNVECVNKQVLIEINWPSKAVSKSALNKATKEVLMIEKEI